MTGLTGRWAALALAFVLGVFLTGDWIADQLFPPPAGGSHQAKGIDDGT
jgi:hypothetical protein